MYNMEAKSSQFGAFLPYVCQLRLRQHSQFDHVCRAVGIRLF